MHDERLDIAPASVWERKLKGHDETQKQDVADRSKKKWVALRAEKEKVMGSWTKFDGRHTKKNTKKCKKNFRDRAGVPWAIMVEVEMDVR